MWYDKRKCKHVWSKCYEHVDNVKGVLTCTHTLTHWVNEWMMLKNMNNKGVFLGEHSLWVRLSVYYQPHYCEELSKIVGGPIPILSWEVLFQCNL